MKRRCGSGSSMRTVKALRSRDDFNTFEVFPVFLSHNNLKREMKLSQPVTDKHHLHSWSLWLFDSSCAGTRLFNKQTFVTFAEKQTKRAENRAAIVFLRLCVENLKPKKKQKTSGLSSR
ncbi:hypothetical protein INR49_017982 [Caranx melampygus]|nr:hypothetical protein INR49_017982 [Caranx melampygus]